MKKSTFLFFSLLMLLSMTACGGERQSGSIGVIGGADGPTDIIIESNAGPETTDTDRNTSDSFTVIGSADGPTAVLIPQNQAPIEGEYYYDLENVVLYLEYYDTLPDNYITKSEARKLGWEGGTPERYLESSAIGGDTFGNREGILPKNSYTECDLNTLGKDSRGAERLVFSDDGHYYHTEDHYASFVEIFVIDGEVVSK